MEKLTKKPKETYNFRLSGKTRYYLSALAKRYDTTQTAALERAVRELAEREKIDAPE